ncbi:DUF262 domain-containing protein [Winogradskyella sp. SM1960]|uniref:DUF262 domain-containing protein n=1 Tax=Winogradskyella sp. SM1960 TaxID=2865955 RepID=UPI001CD7F041|nr:DUF262 domain-containing protein [Winogradskyella sp. SM1960]
MANTLQQKTINTLLGENFFIPYYQRGYRWTNLQVTQLLDDIWEYAKANESNSKETGYFYCLQPVVVKPKEWQSNGATYSGFELIDGQQRVTTIYIILKYLMQEFLKVESLKEDYLKELFTLEYETREGSRDFLNNIKEDFSNVDYYYIFNAYTTIKAWFENAERAMNRRDKDLFLNTLLGTEKDTSSVQVIWYQVTREDQKVTDDENSKQLFNRLNLGKIPLTNAELIKALFLASDKFVEEGTEEAIKKKIIISQLWDVMEQQLNHKPFWSFITNEPAENYQTKIEFLFDIIAGKNKTEKDFYFTFLHFLALADDDTKMWMVWRKIEHYFNILSEWFKNRDKYHKIGYLISIGNVSVVKTLLDEAIVKPKDEFNDYVNSEIKKSIHFEIENLDYTKGVELQNINKLLLLFNVETTRNLDNDIVFYPFELHKKENWSVEHIQAQNSEDFNSNKKKPWLEWLELHLPHLENLQVQNPSDVLVATIAKVKKVTEETITWEKFEDLFDEVLSHFVIDSEKQTNTTHAIANLALLTGEDNSALNNAVFQVKRERIIKLDKAGSYIPICTKRLFLRYYNTNGTVNDNQFWTALDRQEYCTELLSTLKPYLNTENKTFLKNLKKNNND